ALMSTPAGTLTAQVQGDFPSGDAKKGLGTHHTSIEPALLAYGKVNDRLAIEGQFGGLFPIDCSDGVPVTSDDKFAGKVLFYGVGPSYEIFSSDRMAFAPVVELVGWHVVNGQQTNGTLDAGGTNIVNIKVGARATFGQSSLYAGWGHALTDAVWYEDIVRVEYRVRF